MQFGIFPVIAFGAEWTMLYPFSYTDFLSLQYHIDHNRAHFYIDDSATATALHKCSHKITDRDGYKVCSYFFFFKQFFWCISIKWNSHTQFFEILHVCMSASSPIVSF